MKILDQRIEKFYSMYHGDSCEVIKGIPDNSIHYTLFSPPFSSLYTYSNSDRDMGNSKNDEEFYNHFAYLVKELYRVTMPGRLLSFHCMNIPLMKQKDGVIGIKDFRGQLIKLFQDAEKHLYNFYSVLLQAKEKFGKFSGKDEKVEEDFDDAMRDDLNTSKAISYLFNIFKEAKEKITKNDRPSEKNKN